MNNIDIIILVIYILVTILFFLGKGAFLVAGYNTMSDNEKKNINKKRFLRQMGVMLLFVDIALVILIILDRTGKMKDFYAYLFVIYIVTVIIGFTIYIRLSNKKS